MFGSERPKKNKILAGILLLVVGLITVIIGADYVWVLLGTVEIPLQLAGVGFGIVGLIMLIVGIVEKKKKENLEEQQ